MGGGGICPSPNVPQCTVCPSWPRCATRGSGGSGASACLSPFLISSPYPLPHCTFTMSLYHLMYKSNQHVQSLEHPLQSYSLLPRQMDSGLVTMPLCVNDTWHVFYVFYVFCFSCFSLFLFCHCSCFLSCLLTLLSTGISTLIPPDLTFSKLQLI